MVSYKYHVKYLRCHIIGKHHDITVMHQYQNLMWYHRFTFNISHVILDVRCESQQPLVHATKSGTALNAVPKLSKHLVTYMEGLLALSPGQSPYVNGPFDSSAKGVAEAIAAAALSDLNQLANEPYMAYLNSKLGEWYS
jgi:hypothetical protein